jgi:uncharacterized protein (DUF1330 family)
VPAYVVSEVELPDEDEGRRYRELASASASIARHGGRYLVRGAQPQVPEGDWPPGQQVVVVEFASMEQLRAWYSSADYAEALAVAETALSRRLLFVEGVEDPKPRGRPRRPSGSTRGI